jgi:hypothetical protein
MCFHPNQNIYIFWKSKSWFQVYLKKSLEAWHPPQIGLEILNMQKK